MAGDDNALDPDSVVAKSFGVSLRTLDNWDKAARKDRSDDKDKERIPRFPPPIRIHNRKYRRRGEIRQYTEQCAALEAGDNAGFQIVQQRARAVRDDGQPTGRFRASDDGGETA